MTHLINIYSYRSVKVIKNDNLGCNTVSWAPFTALGSLLDDGTFVKRIVTGSCDNIVRIWKCTGTEWEIEHDKPSPHSGKTNSPNHINHIL